MINQAIEKATRDAVKAAETLLTKEAQQFIADLAEAMVSCYENGGKLLVAGNGGSLCDAMHFAEELTGYFRAKRKALPAIALSDPGHMSCVANDVGFETVFSRAVEALGKKEDLLVVLTTSGNSENLVRAVAAAEEIGMKTASFIGKGGGRLKGACHIEWVVEGFSTSDRIQEAHMAAIHIAIEMAEMLLFAPVGSSQ